MFVLLSTSDRKDLLRLTQGLFPGTFHSRAAEGAEVLKSPYSTCSERGWGAGQGTAKGSVGSCKTYSRGCLTFHEEHLQSAPGALMGTNLSRKSCFAPRLPTPCVWLTLFFLRQRKHKFLLSPRWRCHTWYTPVA